MAYYSAHFHQKLCKKLIKLIKFKEQNVVCAHEFSWPRKSYVPHMTCLEFWFLFHVPFLGEYFFRKYRIAYFSALFHKKNLFKKNEQPLQN